MLEAVCSLYVNEHSAYAARLSCGGAIELCDAIATGRIHNASPSFALLVIMQSLTRVWASASTTMWRSQPNTYRRNTQNPFARSSSSTGMYTTATAHKGHSRMILTSSTFPCIATMKMAASTLEHLWQLHERWYWQRKGQVCQCTMAYSRHG